MRFFLTQKSESTQKLLIDLKLTNKSLHFEITHIAEKVLGDYHKMIWNFFKRLLPKFRTKVIYCRDRKTFNESDFLPSLKSDFWLSNKWLKEINIQKL